MKVATIRQIVEAILESAPCSRSRTIANEAVIYYKTATICEEEGIDAAMKYFTGTHSENEYQEFRTETVGGIKND